MATTRIDLSEPMSRSSQTELRRRLALIERRLEAFENSLAPPAFEQTRWGRRLVPALHVAVFAGLLLAGAFAWISARANGVLPW